METLFALPTRPTLILLPDIGGMPEPDDERSCLHRREARMGLYRMLEEANTTGLSVSRTAGDSVLFFRQGEVPDASVIVTQVQRMYHRFLSGWDVILSRFGEECSCVSCRLTDRPTVRFIAHYGPIGGQWFRGVAKLFGLDFMKAYRLLDQTAPCSEHLIVTEALINSSTDRHGWESVLPASQAAQLVHFDLGSISYHAIPLNDPPGQLPVAQSPMMCYVSV
jgi:Protein of unknown function (DUF2652)